MFTLIADMTRYNIHCFQLELHNQLQSVVSYIVLNYVQVSAHFRTDHSIHYIIGLTEQSLEYYYTSVNHVNVPARRELSTTTRLVEHKYHRAA